MQAIIKPSAVHGKIAAPASKSAMQRACAASLLRAGTTVLQNAGVSNDDRAALEIIEKLGAQVNFLPGGSLQIKGTGGIFNSTAHEIHCGESGLSFRMFTPVAALNSGSVRITGSGSLLDRPMNFFDHTLPQLGVSITSNNGKLPLVIQGPLIPADIEIDGSLSSQFLTGLLFAYAGAGAKNVSIRVNNLSSKPYIDLTLQIMQRFGLPVPVNVNYEVFHFPDQAAREVDRLNYTVEGDWSGSAFLLVAGAVSGRLAVSELDLNSTQADRAILQVLLSTGANLSLKETGIEVEQSKLKPFHFNATDCPDLFPPLVALAAFCEGRSVIQGVHRLTHKESNRALTLQEEFGKLGIEIELQDDLMLITGGTGIKSAHVHSRHDHRIAMACAVAAISANGEVIIDEAEAVNKSYPQFWQHLQQLHAVVTLKP